MCFSSEGVCDDKTYSNLWDNKVKTVYDPCPVNYRVSPYETFTGFTYNGDNVAYDTKITSPLIESNVRDAWFNVQKNILPGYDYADGLFGFYTNRTKLLSLGYPLTGYIDYAAVTVYWMKNHGYIWLAKNLDDNDSYFLKYCRNLSLDFGEDGILPNPNLEHGFVGPISGFHATDGCSVRPTKMKD